MSGKFTRLTGGRPQIGGRQVVHRQNVLVTSLMTVIDFQKHRIRNSTVFRVNYRSFLNPWAPPLYILNDDRNGSDDDNDDDGGGGVFSANKEKVTITRQLCLHVVYFDLRGVCVRASACSAGFV